MTHGDDLVSISELHRITGYDRALISEKLAKSNVTFEKRGKSHLFSRRMALAVLVAGSNAIPESDAKSRKAIAEAEKAEITVSKLKGELVSADEMRRAAAELVKSLYQRVVRVEPAVIASKCVGLDAIGIETHIRESMAAIFNDVRTDLAKYMTVEDEGESEENEDADV